MVSHCRELTGVNCGELYMSYKSIFQDVRDAVDFVHDSVSLAPGSLHWRSRQAGGRGPSPPPMDGQKEFYCKKMDFQVSCDLPQDFLQLNPVVHVTITQREGGLLSDVQHVYLYSRRLRHINDGANAP